MVILTNSLYTLSFDDKFKAGNELARNDKPYLNTKKQLAIFYFLNFHGSKVMTGGLGLCPF